MIIVYVKRNDRLTVFIRIFMAPVSRSNHRCCLALLVLVTILPHAAFSADERFPRPQGAVNDFAAVISPQKKAVMESLAREILQKTGTSVVVATFDSIGDNDPAMFANELYEDWGIGKKGEDRGLLIMLAVKERRIRIETGYGVEGILPDGRVGAILDRYVVPLLKKGAYAQGLFNGMAAAGQIIAQDAGVTIGEGYRPTPARTRQVQRRGAGAGSLLMLLFLLPFLFTRSGRRMLPFLLLMGLSGGRSSGFGGGGGFSGGFGGFGGGLSGGGGAGRGF